MFSGSGSAVTLATLETLPWPVSISLWISLCSSSILGVAPTLDAKQSSGLGVAAGGPCLSDINGCEGCPMFCVLRSCARIWSSVFISLVISSGRREFELMADGWNWLAILIHKCSSVRDGLTLLLLHYNTVSFVNYSHNRTTVSLLFIVAILVLTWTTPTGDHEYLKYVSENIYIV